MAAVPIKIVNAKIAGGGQLMEDCTITGSIGLSGVEVGGGPVIPDPEQPPPDPGKPWEVKTVWTPDSGWAVILVPADETTVPTPSKRR
jgi:hypothetical protein